ncbi:DUF1552 domain-containing protein [Tuwongella immobilis]|uniref:DUF1552 domain-containing protein n=1 Tax=Tuwongella immobilis TaxID=692036 RepID=A0A6C2YUT8_9BACT|nr:DUF1552 domain-containing protein [Tuwongella immobilis]VIP05266.1 Uncharacterized protein OS=Planctomyces limnophilus (strain ATCC 43296 / DSM 3776 / IFAM 1008 / 290) GN=Plim_0946 PE=4 SV=1: HXXSHH [Tuwongella immobilis]VTS07888.1 Uncharacterized protein OS=Planctomyces limnophilus (strain ATCC 43296 / DSM 3776 / IFAM 1008 / 290) GN=Plim_0946 PE=4 SV=1: HXXSHH [Tuwongella immobilis]
MPNPLSRRAMLRATGAAIALPFLDAMLPRLQSAPSTFQPWDQSTVQATPRMICCYVPNGVNILEWMPESAKTNLSPTLKTLEPYAKDFTVITGIGHPASQGGHSGADTWLTGANLKAKPGSDYTNTVSIDQLAAQLHGQRTRYPSIQLSDMSGTGGAGHSHTLSFDINGTPLPAENSPRRLFERLFVPETAGDRAATLKRYAERRSILDDVQAEAAALNRRLGKKDQAKMDEYLSSVRETEKQVERMQRWVDVEKPKVDPRHLQLASQPMNGHDRPMWLDVMLELSYLAFITDTTRVITFEWSREAGGYGGGGENHHELSHHGGDSGMLNKLATIDRFHLSKLGRFLGMLKSTREGDGVMLDRTVVVYGSGMNSGKGGEHSPKNLPLLVAGGQKLGLKQGQHLAFDSEKHPPLANVLLTLVQRLGVETNRFSDATGTLTGLV